MSQMNQLIQNALEKTYNWSSLKSFLGTYPELMTYEADYLLAKITGEIDKHGSSELTRRCLMLRHTLRQSREVGVEEAFNRISIFASTKDDRFERLEALESQLHKADTANDYKRFLNSHPELLSHEAETTVMDKYYKYQLINPDDTESLSTILLSRDLICLSRVLGIDKGVDAALNSFFLKNDQLVQAIQDFTFAGSLPRLKLMLEKNPVLLTFKIDEGIEKMILITFQEGQNEVAKMLLGARDILRLCREKGISEAFHIVGLR